MVGKQVTKVVMPKILTTPKGEEQMNKIGKKMSKRMEKFNDEMNKIGLKDEVARMLYCCAQESMEYKGVRRWVGACLELTNDGFEVNSTKYDFYTKIIPALAELASKYKYFDVDGAHQVIDCVIDVQVACGLLVKNKIEANNEARNAWNTLIKCWCDFFDNIYTTIRK